MSANEPWKIALGVVMGLSIFTTIDRLYGTWRFNRDVQAWSDSMPRFVPVQTALGEHESCYAGYVLKRYMAPSGNWAYVFERTPAGALSTCVGDPKNPKKLPD